MIAEFHPLADRELTDAALFYEGQAQGLGADFLDEVEHFVEILCQYPELGRPAGVGSSTTSWPPR